MSETVSRPESSPQRRRLGVALLLAAIALAWSNSFEVPYHFDDLTSLAANESIRHLWPLVPGPFSLPAGGDTVSGRPLLNFTFALNYAVSGQGVRSYHAFNLALHAANALLLLALLRRALRSPALVALGGRDADWLAFVIAALWALHPLQTESVTYLSQRAEVLGAFWILAVLVAFARGAADGRKAWFAAATLAAWAGAAAKETTVVIPVLAALYARACAADTWREVWTCFRSPLLALASSWLLLAGLLLFFGNRGGTAGLGTTSAFGYLLAQPATILHYLRLALWPHPLVFDYGERLPEFSGAAALALMAVLALAVATLWALVRRPALGCAGAAFFVLLAPSSSFVPVASQGMAEHRLYAALALVVGAAVFAGYRWIGRPVLWAASALALVAGALTFQRNAVYASDLRLWTDVTTHAPRNPRGWVNLALAQEAGGRPADALTSYATALALEPQFPSARNNYGQALLRAGRTEEAIHEFDLALGQNPRLHAACFNRANALLALGRLDEAIAGYEDLLRRVPGHIDARLNLGSALHRARRYAEAETVTRALLAVQADSVAAHCNLASTLFATHRTAEALQHLDRAVTLAPDNLTARLNYGTALAVSARPAEAVAQFRAAAALRPDDAAIHVSLADVLARTGERAAARAALDRAIALAPGHPGALRLREQLERP